MALDYYNNWLTSNVGTYPDNVWKKLHAHYGSPVFRHDDHMLALIGKVTALLKQYSPNLFDPQFFEIRSCDNLGINMRTVKPVIKFDDIVKPGFSLGTRGNGVDEARWPEEYVFSISFGS